MPVRVERQRRLEPADRRFVPAGSMKGQGEDVGPRGFPGCVGDGALGQGHQHSGMVSDAGGQDAGPRR